MRIGFTPIPEISRVEIASRVHMLEALRQGRLTLANFSNEILYPLTVFTDIPTRTNPIYSHKFLYGGQTTFDDRFQELIDEVEATKTLSVATGTLTIALSTEDPSGKSSGMNKVGFLTLDIGTNRKVVDWSFWPHLSKKDQPDEQEDIKSVNIVVDDPTIGIDSVTFKVMVETGKISTKNEEFFALSVYYELLLEDYK